MAKRGSPSTYTRDLADIIITGLEAGIGLRDLCDDPGMPSFAAVASWASAHQDSEPAKDGFPERYARARGTWLDLMAEETMRIADHTEEGVKITEKFIGKNNTPVTECVKADMTEHRRLRIDTRKWLLSKLRPDKYGDRTAITGAGGDELVVRIRSVLDEPWKDEKPQK